MEPTINATIHLIFTTQRKDHSTGIATFLIGFRKTTPKMWPMDSQNPVRNAHFHNLGVATVISDASRQRKVP